MAKRVDNLRLPRNEKPLSASVRAASAQQPFPDYWINRKLSSEGRNPDVELMQVGPIRHTWSERETTTMIPGKLSPPAMDVETIVATMPGAKGVLARAAVGTLKAIGFGELSVEGVAAKLLPGAWTMLPARLGATTAIGLGVSAMAPEVQEGLRTKDPERIATAVALALVPVLPYMRKGSLDLRGQHIAEQRAGLPTGALRKPQAQRYVAQRIDEYRNLASRVLRPDEATLSAFTEGTIVRSPSQIRAIIGTALMATEKQSSIWKGLHRYLMHGGGGGFVGVTASAAKRLEFVLGIFRAKDSEVVAAIDLKAIDPSRVYDLSDPSIRADFVAKYPYLRYVKTFDLIASEGAVAILGEIPAEAVRGLVRIPQSLDDATVTALIKELLTGQ